jgi:hypothetical protein
MYHGFGDPGANPIRSIRYRDAVVKFMEDSHGVAKGRKRVKGETWKGEKETDKFLKLYLVPGMAHCGGGKALDDMDALSALVDWVEAGKAPDALVATGAAFPGVSRPMCAWPKTARYDGKGPIDAAASFRCESEPAAGDQSRSGAPSGK